MVFPQEMTYSNSMRSNDDCYFYFYSSCTKGEMCPFRHCQLALGSEIVCSLWKEGRCFRTNCKFRHMESRINRKDTQCFWENQPGGCRKPHCVFFHKKPRTNLISTDEHKGLILPVSERRLSPVPSTTVPSIMVENCSPNNSRSGSVVEEADEGIHSPVEPFVLSIDENEESDAESVSSTPVKMNDAKPLNSDSAKASLLSKLSGKAVEKKLDFEIKSLEQIRLEKLHKESSNIYKTDDLPTSDIDNYFLPVKRKPSLPAETLYSYSDYKIPTLEDYKKQRMYELKQSYPPSSEFISLSSGNSVDVALTSQSKDAPLSTVNKNGDLRNILTQSKKRFSVAGSVKSVDLHNKVLIFKKETNQLEAGLDFKIKTLDEIRKEKKVKKEMDKVENETNGNNQQTVSITASNKSTTVKSASQPALRKLKINRKPTGTVTNAKRKNSTSPERITNKHIKIELTESHESHPLVQGDQSKMQAENPFLLQSPPPNEVALTRETNDTTDSIQPTKECNNSDEISTFQDSTKDSSQHAYRTPSSIENFDEEMSDECENIPQKSCKKNYFESSAMNISSKVSPVNRSISIDDIDHFLKDTEDLPDATVDDADDDIMLQINEFLDS